MSESKLTIDQQYAELRFNFTEAVGMFLVGCELNEPDLIEIALGDLLGMTCPYNPDNELLITMLFSAKEASSFLLREQKAMNLLNANRTPLTEQSVMYLKDIVQRIHSQPAFHP